MTVRRPPGLPTPAAVVIGRATVPFAFNRTTVSDVLPLDLFNTGTLDLSGTKTCSITFATFGSSNAATTNFSVNTFNFSFNGTPFVTLNAKSMVE